MKFRRDLIIVALVTFCLTATIFMAIPTRSSPGEYDPWIDNNEDGAIDIFDAIGLANAFATSGDPTKNVNVMNWPITPQQTVWYAQTSSAWSGYYNASGFGHMHFSWMVAGLSGVEKVTINIHSRIDYSESTFTDFETSELSVTVTNTMGSMSFPVPSERFRFGLNFDVGTTATVYVAFYLTYA